MPSRGWYQRELEKLAFENQVLRAANNSGVEQERLINPKEFIRYLAWRVQSPIFGGAKMTLEQIIKVFGTSPVVVAVDGSLSSPGGRGVDHSVA